MTPDQPLLTTGQVARKLAVNPATVRRWVADGLLQSITLPSGLLRFRAADIDAMIEPAKAEPARAAS